MTAISHQPTARNFFLQIHGCTNFASVLSAPISPLSGCKSTAEPHLILPCLDSSAHYQGNFGWKSMAETTLILPCQPPSAHYQGNFGWKSTAEPHLILPCLDSLAHYQGNFGWKYIYGWTNHDSALSASISVLPCQGYFDWNFMAVPTLRFPVCQHQPTTRENSGKKFMAIPTILLLCQPPYTAT